jgi:hypothetical protein
MNYRFSLDIVFENRRFILNRMCVNCEYIYCITQHNIYIFSNNNNIHIRINSTHCLNKTNQLAPNVQSNLLHSLVKPSGVEWQMKFHFEFYSILNKLG